MTPRGALGVFFSSRGSEPDRHGERDSAELMQIDAHGAGQEGMFAVGEQKVLSLLCSGLESSENQTYVELLVSALASSLLKLRSFGHADCNSSECSAAFAFGANLRAIVGLP